MTKPYTLFFDTGEYGSHSFISSWINVSSSNYERLNVFCSANCDFIIEYAMDDEYIIVDSECHIHHGGDLFSKYFDVIYSFLRVSIVDIDTQKCDLKSQFILYLD